MPEPKEKTEMNVEKETILETYRAAYRRANGVKAQLYSYAGWVYLDEVPYRLKALVSMTAVLNERAEAEKV